MKVIRKPLVSLFILLVIASTIFFMSSLPDKHSLGNSSPINIPKDSKGAINNAFNNQAEKSSSLTSSQEVLDFTSDEKDKSNVPINLELTETPFMPKMANETLKAQLGNAAWKLFHTILARFPEEPSIQEQQTLSQYIHLFAQVYPCGDCARHFQQLLQKYPPQTTSRIIASTWGCDIHNKVNKRLDKPEYDCSKILEDYDCGCGSDEKEEDSTLTSQALGSLRNDKVEGSKEDTTLNSQSLEHLRSIKVDEKENVLQLGG